VTRVARSPEQATAGSNEPCSDWEFGRIAIRTQLDERQRSFARGNDIARAHGFRQFEAELRCRDLPAACAAAG
jgi:hypothetical protein